MAISAIHFAFIYNKSNKATVNYDDSDDKKAKSNDNSADKTAINGSREKENAGKIDWQPIMEKWKAKDISRIETDRKVIALTFDGGANTDGVEKILDILKDNDIKGTFFLTGKFIEKYPLETKMIIASGGNIGNHSYSHPYFTKLTDEEIGKELEGTEGELSKLNATFHPFFRFPYGNRDEKAISTINENNYISIRWTVDSLGWEGTSSGMTKEAVENRVLSKTVPGAIVLMHLGTNPDDKTQLDSEALPEIISKLKKQGYEFTTLTELLDVNNF